MWPNYMELYTRNIAISLKSNKIEIGGLPFQQDWIPFSPMLPTTLFTKKKPKGLKETLENLNKANGTLKSPKKSLGNLSVPLVNHKGP